MRYLFCLGSLILLLWSNSCNTPSHASSLVSSSEVAPSEFVLKQRLRVLLHDEELYQHIRIDSSGITLYASAEARMIDSPEVKIYPDEYLLTAELYRMMRPDSMVRYYHEKGTQRWADPWKTLAKRAMPAWPSKAFQETGKPLDGWRIAVDPGHIAGDLAMAETEGKYVRMRASRLTEFRPVAFWEANLTLATAHLIRDQLMEMGATVMMTRYTPGLSIAGQTYEEWKQQHWPQAVRDSAESWELTPRQLSYWLTRADDKAIMRSFYTAEDLRNRAEIINAFRPHMTLVIHYNVHGPNWENRDAEGNIPPADTNYLMAFVPGSFLRRELQTVEDRASLLRLLLTRDLMYSQELATAFVRASQELTSVPVVPPNHQLAYLTNSSVYTGSPGVYARNLSLTRLIKGPIVYGESLNQDYVEEAVRLTQRDTIIHGIPVSSRVKDVADAYVQAVLTFAQDDRLH